MKMITSVDKGAVMNQEWHLNNRIKIMALPDPFSVLYT